MYCMQLLLYDLTVVLLYHILRNMHVMGCREKRRQLGIAVSSDAGQDSRLSSVVFGPVRRLWSRYRQTCWSKPDLQT